MASREYGRAREELMVQEVEDDTSMIRRRQLNDVEGESI